MKARRFVEVFFLVRGSGEFPLDMLRYDSCCPFRESDSHAMRRREARVILMRRFSPERHSDGNEARWMAFGWEAYGWSPDREKLLHHPDLEKKGW